MQEIDDSRRKKTLAEDPEKENHFFLKINAWLKRLKLK